MIGICNKKEEVIMQECKTQQYSYQFGKITFIVTPVYKEQGESLLSILLKLMKADIERD